MKNNIFLALFLCNFIVHGHILDTKNRILDALHKQYDIKEPVVFIPIKPDRIYLTSFNNRSVIVRVNEHCNTNERINEFVLQAEASLNGFGPTVFFSDAEHYITFIEKIENNILIPKNIDMYLTPLVSSLHLMHQTKDYCGKCYKFTDNVLNQLKSLNAKQQRDVNIYEFYGNLARLTHLFNNENLVLVHGDLHPFNVFFTTEESLPKCRFIDFELAHYDSPFVDLAFVALFYGMNKSQEKKLLELYFNRSADSTDFIKLTAMKCFVCAHLFYLMFAYGASEINKKNPFDVSRLQYTPPLNIFIHDSPIDIHNPEWCYRAGISAVKTMEELFHQLDQYLLGDTSLVMPENI